MKTVSAFIEEKSGDPHWAHFSNTKQGRFLVRGWITSDNIVIFTEEPPLFCPKTGEHLILAP